jgi:phospholipid/cholesterol/gamma-HCH transport system substrate-binding protein
MEVRASYLIVGAVVLTLLAGLAAFSVWLVRADINRDVARYEIAFAGSVSGLQEGGQVLYRGIPVGSVAEIRIDPDNVETILVGVEIERDTPIKEDTIATLEFQGLTGIAYVQLRGGTQASARLDPDAMLNLRRGFPRAAPRSSACSSQRRSC